MVKNQKRDILKDVDGLAKEIITLISAATDDQQEGIQMLTNIKMKAEAIREQTAIMIKYRELRNRSIYIYYAETGDYEEANRTQKIKIAREFLKQEGKI